MTAKVRRVTGFAKMDAAKHLAACRKGNARMRDLGLSCKFTLATASPAGVRGGTETGRRGKLIRDYLEAGSEVGWLVMRLRAGQEVELQDWQALLSDWAEREREYVELGYCPLSLDSFVQYGDMLCHWSWRFGKLLHLYSESADRRRAAQGLVLQRYERGARPVLPARDLARRFANRVPQAAELEQASDGTSSDGHPRPAVGGA